MGLLSLLTRRRVLYDNYCGGYAKMMKLEKIDITKSDEYLQFIYSLNPVYSNYFGQPFASVDQYLKTDNTFILIKPIDDFNKIYLVSNNRPESEKLLKSFEGIHVMNLPSKNDISLWKQLMHDTGYENTAVYDRYYFKEFRTGGDAEQIIYAQPEQQEEIYNLYYGYEKFSRFSDYLPLRIELKNFIENKQVIINKDDKNIVGVFIFEIQGKKCYLRLWIDKSHTINGLKLYLDMFTIICDKGIKYAYTWINSENTRSKTIQQSLGAIPDGLKDYTFVKQ